MTLLLCCGPVGRWVFNVRYRTSMYKSVANPFHLMTGTLPKP